MGCLPSENLESRLEIGAGRVARCAAALFFLFLSYYLIKPLRNSQFLKEFPPEALPLIYLVVSGGSLVITRIFQWCCRRFSRRLVVASTFVWALGCKLLFYFALSAGGQSVTALFYFWASIYFLLLVSTLWGSFNERFTTAQGERWFPLIALGATVGNIAGSFCADATSGWGYASLLASAGALAACLFLLWKELTYPVLMPARSSQSDLPRSWNWVGHPGLRAIAVMVLALAVFSTSSDFVTQRRLDVLVGQEAYQRYLGGMWPGGYAELSALRKTDSGQRPGQLLRLAEQHRLPLPQLQSAYQDFARAHEQRLREVFATTYLSQGLAGVVVLGLICRPFLRLLGLTAALTVLPVFALVALPILTLPLDLLWVQILLVVSGTLNYSFNNAAKEILYTSTDRQAIIEAKPIIEGPLMRAGDVICALMTLVSAWWVAHGGLPEEWQAWLLIAPTLALVLLWLVLVRQAGKAYEAQSVSG